MIVSIKFVFCYFVLISFTSNGVCTRSPDRKSENNIIIEKWDYEVLNKKDINLHYFNVQLIAPNVFRANISVTSNRPYSSIWIHGILNYKYQTYQKFLVDVREEGCAFLHNTTTWTPFGGIVWDNWWHFKETAEWNFELKCPFHGTLSGSIKSFNASEIVVPLFPAGRYRVDGFLSSTKYGPVEAKASIYCRISDLRTWF